MLDIRATTGTPGAVGVANLANLVTAAANDGTAVPGVPIRPDARLILWGSNSLIANTIAQTRLISQDLIDPINGEILNLNTTSLQNQAYKFTNVPYKTGSRLISQTTNTAQTATSQAFTLDYYEGGPVANPGWTPINQIVLPQTLTADVAITWTATGIAPTVAIPNGKYALLGLYNSVQTEAHCYRFKHADFGSFVPGFPCVGQPNSAIFGLQKGMKDELSTNPGMQFVALSDILKRPCCPVFTVSNAGTGLIIESMSAAATDTPLVQLCLAKVG